MADEPKTLDPWDAMGYPKPANNPPTKAAVREAYRMLVMPELKPIIEAQIAKARGVNHFMLREPETGQWRRLTDPDEIAAALNDPRAVDGSTFYVHTKDPDIAALTDLLNRTMDKPKEADQDAPFKASVQFSWLKTEE